MDAKPIDYEDVEDKLSYGLKYSEQPTDEDSSSAVETQPSASRYDAGIFTKYPDAPVDVERRKRDVAANNTLPPVELLHNGAQQNASRPQRQTAESEPKVQLQSLISAIESHIVHSAEQANAAVAKRSSRSAADEAKTESAATVDVNKDLFEGIFEYTRPQRQATGDEKQTVQLDGLISAVEQTLINSAQILEAKQTAKREAESAEHERLARDLNVDDQSAERNSKEIHLVRITPNKPSDLSLLSPITFRSTKVKSSESSESSESAESSTVAASAPRYPKDVLAVLHSSENTHLVPSEDSKVTHLQHQQITQAIFKSSLPILPTIPPERLQTPSLPATTDSSQEKHDDAITVPPKPVKETEKEKLKRKFAEVEAVPVILSTGL